VQEIHADFGPNRSNFDTATDQNAVWFHGLVMSRGVKNPNKIACPPPIMEVVA